MGIVLFEMEIAPFKIEIAPPKLKDSKYSTKNQI